MDKYSENYENIWDTFFSELRSFSKKITEAADITNYHHLIKELYDIPVDKARKFLETIQGGTETPNPGSFTGLFFEYLIDSFLQPYINEQCPGADIQRNNTKDENIGKVAKNPDFHISYKKKDVILEVKVAPKLNDIKIARKYREKYRNINVDYYLVGGWISVNKGELRALKNEGWCCFFDGSKRNQHLIGSPTFDEILHKIVDHLNN